MWWKVGLQPVPWMCNARTCHPVLHTVCLGESISGNGCANSGSCMLVAGCLSHSSFSSSLGCAFLRLSLNCASGCFITMWPVYLMSCMPIVVRPECIEPILSNAIREHLFWLLCGSHFCIQFDSRAKPCSPVTRWQQRWDLWHNEFSTSHFRWGTSGFCLWDDVSFPQSFSVAALAGKMRQLCCWHLTQLLGHLWNLGPTEKHRVWEVTQLVSDYFVCLLTSWVQFSNSLPGFSLHAMLAHATWLCMDCCCVPLLQTKNME